MKRIIVYLLLILTEVTYSQDTCSIKLNSKYADIPKGVTEFFHDNKKLNYRYIKKGEKALKTFEWDSCGRLIRKSKSGKTLKKTPYYKTTRIEYHPNGQVKMKLNAKMIGCLHIKNSKRKDYNKDGKRIR